MQIVPTVIPYKQGVGETDQPDSIQPRSPVRPVVARTIPPLVIQHFRAGERRGEGEAPFLESPPAPIERRKGGSRREGADRRLVCRRLTNVPVLLDTRAGDRRHGARREDELVVTAIDVEA